MSADSRDLDLINPSRSISLYPDEPHPDDEYAWKSWWVKKCFDPKRPLTSEAYEWVCSCWNETKARYLVRTVS